MRWLIVAFWAFVIIMCGKSFYDYNSSLDKQATAQVEQHAFAPPLPGAQPPAAPSQNADVRQVSYIPTETPMSSQFTAMLTIKNFGGKTATNIQVRVQPYITSVDSSKQVGPDEILNPSTTDQMANVFQWVEFPDLAPGQTATQTLTFPLRPDAEPRTRFEPKITFDTVKDAKP